MRESTRVEEEIREEGDDKTERARGRDIGETSVGEHTAFVVGEGMGYGVRMNLRSDESKGRYFEVAMPVGEEERKEEEKEEEEEREEKGNDEASERVDRWKKGERKGLQLPERLMKKIVAAKRAKEEIQKRKRQRTRQKIGEKEKIEALESTKEKRETRETDYQIRMHLLPTELFEMILNKLPSGDLVICAHGEKDIYIYV